MTGTHVLVLHYFCGLSNCKVIQNTKAGVITRDIRELECNISA